MRHKYNVSNTEIQGWIETDMRGYIVNNSPVFNVFKHHQAYKLVRWMNNLSKTHVSLIPNTQLEFQFA